MARSLHRPLDPSNRSTSPTTSAPGASGCDSDPIGVPAASLVAFVKERKTRLAEGTSNRAMSTAEAPDPTTITLWPEYDV
ncbi:hypothetical protein M427DRAFT_157418, partial [Gonapodya prolifera JEL478]